MVDRSAVLDFNDARPQFQSELTADRGMLAIYLDVVFGYCDGWIPFRGFVDQGAGQDGEPYNEWVEAHREDLCDWMTARAAYCSRSGTAAYCIPGTVAERGQAKANEVVQTQVLVVDIDGGNVAMKLAHAAQWLGTPTLIVESGGRTEDGQDKIHGYWQLSEPAEGDRLELVAKLRHAMAVKIGGDTHFQSLHQPIRMAGTVYHKHMRTRLVSIRAHNAVEYELDDLTERVDAMPPLFGLGGGEFDFNSAGKPKTAIGDVFTRPVREGGKDEQTRFEAISQIIGYWIRRAHEGHATLDQADTEIRDYNLSQVRPPWPEDRLLAETRRLWKKHCDEHGDPTPDAETRRSDAKERFRFLDIDQIEAQEPPDWLIEKLITDQGFSCITGAPKNGKSFVAIDMALSIAYGVPWQGKRTKQAGVIYIAQEGVRGFGKRVRAWRQQHGLLGKDATFLLMPSPVNMLDATADVAVLIDEIKKRGSYGLIIIDTLARTFITGDENATKDMNIFVANAAKVWSAIDGQLVAVHHSGKDKTNNPFRGAGSLIGAIDTGLVVEKVEGTSRLTVTTLYQKDDEDGEVIDLELSSIEVTSPATGEVQKSCVVTAPLPPARLGPVQSALIDLLADKGPMAWAEIRKALQIGKSSLNAAVKSTVETGLVVRITGFETNDQGPIQKTVYKLKEDNDLENDEI